MRIPPAGCAWTQPRTVLVCSIFAALILPAAAAEKTWVSNTSGSWSSGANWLDGIAPPLGGDPTLALRFSPAGPANVTAANDLDQFSVNRLVLDRDGGGILTLSGSRLRLTGASPVIELAGSSYTTISAEMMLDPLSGDAAITGTGAGNLTISGLISQSGTRRLVIAAQPATTTAQIILLSASNTFSGGLVLQSGNLALTSGAPVGTGTMVVNGGTLQFNNGSAVGFARPISLNSDLRFIGVGVNGGVTFVGVISSNLPGTGLTYRPEGSASAGTIILNSASTYTGATRLDFGTGSGTGSASLQITGSALNSSLFDIRANGTLFVSGTNTATAANRLGDATPVELHSGRLTYSPGTGTGPQTETIGPLRVSGYSTVSILPTTTTSPRVTAQSLARLERGTVLFRGRSLGSTPAVNVASMFFTNTPTLVGGGGTGLQTSIVPYAIGSTSGVGPGSGFVTYSATTGIRLLATGEFATGMPAGVTTQNVQLASNLADFNDASTINSLALVGGSLGGSGTITITSGALLNTTVDGSFGNPLNFGTSEGIVFSVGAFTISGAISGSGGLTKSGDQTLTLAAPANPFTGQLTINSGQLLFDSAGQLGASASPIVLDGQGAGLTYTGAAPLNLARGFTIASGVATHRATGSGTLELSGAITGPGGLSLAPAASSTVVLTGSNTFSGPMRIAGPGTIAFSSDAALGGGELNLDGGTTRPHAAWNSSRVIRVGGTAALDTTDADARWNGLLVGTGALTKTGSGTLTIATGGPYSGAVTVDGGTLRFDNAMPLHSRSFTINAAGRLMIDKSAAAGTDQIDDLAVIKLGGGELALFGNATADTSETVGVIEVPANSTGGAVTLTPAGSFGATLRAASLAPVGSHLLVRGAQLGGSAGAAFTRLVATAPPPEVGGIVRNAYAQELSSAQPVNFAIYDTSADAAGVIGLRPLRSAELTTGAEIRNPANGGSTPVAANFVAGLGTTAGGAENTIHSLTLEPGGSLTLGGAQRLTLGAAALLVRPGGGGASVSGGIVDFGAGRGSIGALGDLTFGSAISGTAGWDKTGAGVLTLLAAQTNSGVATIREGVLRLGNSGVLDATSLELLPNAALELNGFATTLGSLNGSGEVRLGASPLTLGALGEDLAFAGRFTGTGLLTIIDGGNPLALRSLTGTAPLAGGLALASGRLAVRATNAFSNSTITIDGGILQIVEPASLAASFVLNSDLRIRGAAALTLASSGAIAGAGSLVLEDAGNLVIQSTADHTGETLVAFGRAEKPSAAPGTITVSGAAGSLTATSAIRIVGGSTLFIDNTVPFAGPADGRIPNASPVFLSSSKLQLTAAASVATSETAGPLHGSGFSIVTVSPGTSASALLTFGSLNRTDRGTFLFRAPGLGSVLANGVGSVRLATAPTGDLVGGGGSGPNVSILPYAIGDSSATGPGTGLVTYDAANGIRLLNASTEHAASLATAAPTHNVRLTANATLDAAQTVNALVMNTTTLGGAGTLTVSSGAVLTNLGTISANLDFGTAEAQVFVPGTDVRISNDGTAAKWTGILTGSGGLTKSGLWDLNILGTNQITGPLTINAGNVRFSTLAQLGADSSPVRINADVASAGLMYIGSSPLTFSRGIEILGGYGALRTASIGTLDVTGVISGAGGVGITSTDSFGRGYVRLSAANTYRGPTVVQGGLTITSDAALGDGGAVELKSSIYTGLRLDGDWTTSRRIVVSAASLLELNGRNAQWLGAIENTASLTLQGPGLLEWRSPSAFTGALGVSAASTLSFNGAGATAATGFNLSTGGQLVLDNSALALGDRLADTAQVVANGGGFTLRGSATTAVRERVGELRLSPTDLAPSVTLESPGNFATILEAATLVSSTAFPSVVRGTGLGESGGSFSRLVFQTAPALVGRLLPMVLVEDPVSGTADSFATYDQTVDAAGVVGVRSLRPAEYTSAGVIRNPDNGGATLTSADLFIAGPATAVGAANTVNSLTFAGSGALTLEPAQTLRVSMPALLVRSGADAAIEGGQLALGTTVSAIVHGELALRSRLAETSGLQKLGLGRLRLTADAIPNTFTAIEGLTELEGPGPVFFRNLSVKPAATVDLKGQTASIIGGGTIEGTMDLGGGTFIVNAFSLVYGSLAGSGLLRVGAFLRIFGPSSYTAPTRIEPDLALGQTAGGTLVIETNGSALNSSSFSLKGGATLQLQSGPTGSPRIGAVPVTLNSSTLRIYRSFNAPLVQQVGPLTGIGFPIVEFMPPTSSGTPQSSQLRFSELIRQDRAIFDFGNVVGTAPVPGVTNVFFESGLTSHLVGAGTTATSQPIVPFAVQARNLSGASRPMLLTYSTAHGLRPLDLITEYSSALTAGDNVRLTTSVVQNLPITVNSLMLDGGSTSGTGVIRVSSGTVVGASQFSSDTIANPLDFGAVDGKLIAGGLSLHVSGRISGSGGLTISMTRRQESHVGGDYVGLSGTNTFTGPLTVNGGTLLYEVPANLGQDTGPIVLNDARLEQSVGASGTSVLSRPIRLNGTLGQITGGTENFTVTGVISGDAGLRAEHVTLAAANTYTGPTVIAEGVRIASDAALGTNPFVRVDGFASLKLLGNWQSSRTVRFTGSGGTFDLDTNSFNARIAGITGTGRLGKVGSGKLEIADASTFTDAITLAGGGLFIDGELAAGSEIQVPASTTLGGGGDLHRAISVSGLLAPGDDIGPIGTGNLTFNGGSTLALEFASPTAFDRVVVTGNVSLLNSAHLLLTLLFDPADGVDRFTIIENDGSDLVSLSANSGFVFAGTTLREGQRFNVGSQEFQISYAGGDGNDVVLAATPEPGSLALFACGGALLLRRRRGRARALAGE